MNNRPIYFFTLDRRLLNTYFLITICFFWGFAEFFLLKHAFVLILPFVLFAVVTMQNIDYFRDISVLPISDIRLTLRLQINGFGGGIDVREKCNAVLNTRPRTLKIGIYGWIQRRSS